MAQMTEAVRAVGILQAVVVRPLGDGSYELVFGHRRLRAALAAKLAFIPAIVRELTDAESAQVQAVENLQREDLDAIDEAMGFAAYISTHGCTKDDFSRRTGLSRTQVYNRLKLATLHDAGRQALREGKIQSEVATLLARVPSEKHQAHGLKLILDSSPREGGGPADELMTVRKARSILREKFTLGLKDALWKLDDATLVESAGACTVCPKRSGVDPTLYVDLLGKEHSYSRTPNGENVCTDPACFDIKKTAQLKANQAVLEAKGKTVIAGGKARQVIGAYGDIKGGYIPLKDVKDAIKKAASNGQPAPIVMTVQNPRDGKTVEVVKLEDVKAAGVKVVEPKKSTSSHTSYGSPEWKVQQAQEQAEREKAQVKAKADTDFNMALLAKVREASAKVPRCTLDLQLIAQLAISGVQHSDRGVIETLYGADNIHDLRQQLGSWPAQELSQFLLDCAMAHNVVANGYGRSAVATPLLTAAKHYGVDAAAMRKEHANVKKAEAAAGAKPPVTKAAKGKGKIKAVAPIEDDADVQYPNSGQEEHDDQEAEA